MPLSTEVDLGPGHIVLDGDPALISEKGAQQPSPIFGPCLLWPNSWMDQDATWCGCRPWPWPHCVRWWPSSPKGAQPPIFRRWLLWPNGRPSQLLCWTLVYVPYKGTIQICIVTLIDGFRRLVPLVHFPKTRCIILFRMTSSPTKIW